MLLSNRFQFFNKNGDNVNPQKRQATSITIVDPGQFPGVGAIINAYTNFNGQVIYFEILDGGTGYDPLSYIEVRSIDDSRLLYTVPNTDITIDANGTITEIVLTDSINNFGFPSPSLDYFIDYSLERVSTGLIAVDQLYILENVFYNTGVTGPSGLITKNEYTYPRVDSTGEFEIKNFSANGSSGKVEIMSYAFTGIVSDYARNTVRRVPSSVILDLGVGMNVIGTGIPDNTFIYSIDVTRQTIVLTNLVEEGTLSLTAYIPHNLRIGSKINIVGGALAGDGYSLTQVNDFNLYFDSTQTVSTTAGGGAYYSVVPQYRAEFDPGDPSFFFFTVDYGVDYPTITKTRKLEFEFAPAPSTDIIPTATVGGTAVNGIYQRTITEDLQKSPFTLNIGHQSDVEGVYVGILRIFDVTFEDKDQLIFYGVYRAETEAEDERLGLLLENLGRDVDRGQELILRESDVNESNIDYILLNQKRKEMLLQGDQIWPYLGSYKGLVNMVNWFGYNDIRLKEYFLNINSMDAEFGKYRQVPITFQLKNKKQSPQELVLVPSMHYKKTSLFGLFYDIVKDSGEFDSNGTPITEEAFDFTNEEALIKFFALKRYLKEKFLPLNAQIVDITGEGVYYERYTINSWKDVDERRIIELTRAIDFSCEERVAIEDLRAYSSRGLLSPAINQNLQSFLNKYDILDITVDVPGGPYTSVPLVSFPGTSNQTADGYCFMKGYTGSYTLANPAGTNYVGGEIITMTGGVFEVPLRVIVTGVSGGAVTDVDIVSGPNQGSKYRSFPETFGQSAVLAAVGTQYQVVDRSGFTAAPSDLGFEVEDVWFLTKGFSYTTLPSAVFTPNIGGTDATLELKIYETEVGNINNGIFNPRWNDAPNIPVGAIASLSTEFPITWDEVPYSWLDIYGSDDANVKVYIDPLPTGTGEVIAAEIVNPGTNYTFVPTIQVVSQSGSGAEIQGSLRDSKLNVLEYVVTAVSSGAGTNDIFTVTPDVAAAGVRSVSLNRLVKGENISDIVLTSAVTTGTGSTITVEEPGGGAATTTVQTGDIIYVHEGVEVTNGGVGYSNVPGVNVNSGHTRSIFTWNNLGRGDFYQMQWKVKLQEAAKVTDQFNYDSGILPIDLLQEHTVVLPYIGKYTVEIVVYDTDNNFANLIKKNCVEVYMLDADFSYVSKYLNTCIDTWDSTKQLPNTLLNIEAEEAENNRNIRYNWDTAHSRWVNLVFNDTIWDNADLRWDVLNITDQSIVNNYHFPFSKEFNILEVSPFDNVEGPVLEYRDSTTSPSSINPTIIVSGQRSYPELEAAYTGEDEWIFIRRDGTVYQLDVLDADYSNPGYTYIELVSTPPAAFRSSPSTWEVLREIRGTIVVEGNQVYDPDTKPNGLKVGKFLKAFQKNPTPIRSRLTINSKNTYSGQPSYITLDGQGTDSVLTKKGEIGKIYKIRDHESLNGNLVWDASTASSVWVIRPASTDDPEIRDHVGRIYIDAAAVTADVVNEIRPGFTLITLYAYVDDVLQYTQQFRSTHAFLDTSTVGEGYNIWLGDTITIDVKGIDGGSIDDLETYLTSLSALGTPFVYLEYEYQEFTSRTYYGENSSGDMDIYFDFNTYPSSSVFNQAQSTDFDNTAIANHTNWFFDHGIDSGDFSMKISQVGLWQGGVGTIITVSDEDNDLMRMSSSFTISQRNFDEDSAERKLGTDVITWMNYRDVVWEETCAISWNTLDWSTPYWCNFIIDEVVQNSGLQFNEEDTYSFTELVGGMSTAQIYATALHELNNLTEGGLAKFNYYPTSESDLSRIYAVIDTYENPSSFTTDSAVSVGDVIYGNPFDYASTVSAVTGTQITLDKEIRKKASFIGSCVSGEYKIKNIASLLENGVVPGDVITSTTLPSYPSSAATVTNVVTQGGMIREISLSEPFSASGTNVSFYVEWTAGKISTQVLTGGTGTAFNIIAQANTPSVDCLGFLTGDSGLTFITPDGSTLAVSHTFPTGNYYEWLGFGPNKVGSFLNGINEFVINYRNIQTYLSEGISPIGYKGWYPATNLPYVYSFLATSAFSNNAEAEGQSERLPYERSIGGALTWEETWMDSRNGKFPVGSSVILTSDTSKIPGKSAFLWKIKENDEILVETTDSAIMWTFTYPGTFGVELTIQDSNGNANTLSRNTFIEVYEATES